MISGMGLTVESEKWCGQWGDKAELLVRDYYLFTLLSTLEVSVDW